ncbi:MAG TPA: hypothetical protein VGD45_33405 [Steroidobacter sp.]|uniref:hypothetical protein n=1 Tax=Steroidobacter sp. TaxID=1978227 RepID=UPI002EDAFBCB
MQPLPQTTGPCKSHKVVPMDGYVHKFRLESNEEAAADRWPPWDTTPTVSLGSLLGKFVLSVVALAGIAAAGARALI